MRRTEKEQLREELHGIFSSNPHGMLVGFSGLTVNDAGDLRRKLREANCSYRVVKNTIAKIAAEGTPYASVSECFDGTTAVAYSDSDPIGLAKVFKDFAKDHKVFTFKAFMLDGKVMTGDHVEAVAAMPTKEESLAKLLFLLKHPVTSLARVLVAPLRDLGIVLNETKKES